MSPSFQSNIQPPSDGWMRFNFIRGGVEIDIDASYTPWDSFSIFIGALESVRLNYAPETIRFNEEPEVMELSLKKAEDEIIFHLMRTRSEVTFSTPFKKTYTQIGQNLYHLFQNISLEEFKAQWRHAAPKEQINRLWPNIIP